MWAEPAATRATFALLSSNALTSTMTGFRDRRASLLSFAVALPLASIALAACNKKQERAPRQAATVAVVPARRASVPYMIEANGVVTPMQSVSVLAQVDGIITSVDFHEGQEVQAGQPLFHIDARPYENAYEQALAVLARDSANAANAKAEAARYQKLLDARVITPQEGAAQFTTAAATDATVRADRANVANAKFNLENTVVRAPISGKTGALLVKKGNLVRAGGGSPLVVINQVRPILVRFSIPSSQLNLVLQYGAKGGLPVAAVPGGVAPPSPSIDSLAAAASDSVADMQGTNGSMASTRSGAGGLGSAAGALGSVVQQGNLGGERVIGRLSFIDNAVDTATGTVQLKATFDNSNGRLWAGQFASTSLHLFDEDSALVVPAQAVVTGQRGAYVYIVDPSDTARQRAVTVERYAGGLAIISNGVHDGDRVVIDGQSRLTPDAPVRFRGATEADAGSAAGGARRGKRGGKGGNRANAGGQNGGAPGGEPGGEGGGRKSARGGGGGA